MIELSIQQILDITGGRASQSLDPAGVISSVTTDSREVAPGRCSLPSPANSPTGTPSSTRRCRPGRSPPWPNAKP
nr:hypothetical protein [Arthrobacter sp. JCM 19049]